MVKFTGLITTSCLFVAVACSPVARSVPQVQSDIAKLNAAVVSIDSAIKNFSGTVQTAAAIHQQAIATGHAAVQAAADIRATGAFTQADSKAIASAVLAIQMPLEDSLFQIKNKKQTVLSFPISGLKAIVHKDLLDLKANTDDFMIAVVASAQGDQKKRLTDMKTAVDAQFDSAIAVYQ